ncbi:Undecaprenyl-phosphate N-acetylglucosaminyl 1-phosphate transferase [Thioalkalivibrio nitratireducens DSM 14787]|uniref:Undecaprenyl-phosphate N-acetylglucosaminyl 1-phosphate transferase n=1 Tax=Thioalkalivibrio nitratireducens (strain DSM 14787 / UNIQEM 213 / ALEN2) TaxID=1255043 RepID=L0DYX3_THIND|nr:glycosyltransferase family 4 protein [Thioalkalivibrio nitratireducens]AGA33561.1 Undecaprenyl-phosphate N-acetylglucosaminyl 1-phosphate transferase [Thioalkalivibrio nitratireducens DSM 14787]
MEGLLAVALSLGLSAGGTAYLASPGARLQWMDHPNERSLHQCPVPRTGGLAILGGLLAGWAVLAAFRVLPAWLGWIAAAAALVAFASLLDDRRGVGVGPRLAAHGLAALVLLFAGLFPESLTFPGWIWIPAGWALAILGTLFVVWMVNLYNFMDGMDGFAGGMAAIGFGFMAWLGWNAGADGFALASLCVALAAAGFLWFNFPPARIFMGDTGASTLGLLAAALMLWAERDGIFPLWTGVLIFSPFIVDATVTLAARAVSGERVWQPHRQHAYQRLVRSGWTHRRTVLAEYLLMAAAGLSALALLDAKAGVQAGALLVWTGVYGIILFWVWRRDWRGWG